MPTGLPKRMVRRSEIHTLNRHPVDHSPVREGEDGFFRRSLGKLGPEWKGDKPLYCRAKRV